MVDGRRRLYIFFVSTGRGPKGEVGSVRRDYIDFIIIIMGCHS